MKTTNERFDEQLGDLWKLTGEVGESGCPKLERQNRQVKTFIHQEKLLLLDQAIEVLEGMKRKYTRPNKSFIYMSQMERESVGDNESFNLALSQVISKLKELKKGN